MEVSLKPAPANRAAFPNSPATPAAASHSGPSFAEQVFVDLPPASRALAADQQMPEIGALHHSTTDAFSFREVGVLALKRDLSSASPTPNTTQSTLLQAQVNSPADPRLSSLGREKRPSYLQIGFSTASPSPATGPMRTQTSESRPARLAPAKALNAPSSTRQDRAARPIVDQAAKPKSPSSANTKSPDRLSTQQTTPKVIVVTTQQGQTIKIVSQPLSADAENELREKLIQEYFDLGLAQFGDRVNHNGVDIGGTLWIQSKR